MPRSMEGSTGLLFISNFNSLGLLHHEQGIAELGINSLIIYYFKKLTCELLGHKHRELIHASFPIMLGVERLHALSLPL